MSKHTPGPWVAKGPSVETEDGGLIAAVLDPTERGTTVPDPYVVANAHLIAAAPDLLEALKKALNVLVSEPANITYRAHREIVEAAIAKAEALK